LGGAVSFQYCRYHLAEKEPCWKILDCWWESFDIVGLLKQELGEEAVNRLANTRPPPKTASLMTLIEQAQKRCTEDSS
jgi:hypothetical protein